MSRRAPYLLAALLLLGLVVSVVRSSPRASTTVRSASPLRPSEPVESIGPGSDPAITPEVDAPSTTATAAPGDPARPAEGRKASGGPASLRSAPVMAPVPTPASDGPGVSFPPPQLPTTTSPASSSSRCEAAVRRRPGPVADLGTYLSGPNGQDPVFVTSGIDPGVWSNDGSRLLFRVDHGNRRTMSLCVLEPTGTARELTVVPYSGAPSQQAWVGNDRVMLEFGGQYSNLGLLDVDTGAKRVLLERGSQFSISPDGRTMVATLTSPAPQNLHLVDIDSGADRILADLPHEFSATALQWLPDGASVAYIADGLYTVRTADGARARIAGTDTGTGGYGWSSDGRTVAMLDYGTGGGQADLVVANADGTGRRILATGKFHSLRWRHGSRLLAVTESATSRSRLRFVNPDDGSMRTVLDVPTNDDVRFIIDRLWTPGSDRIEYSLWQLPPATN